MRSGFNILQKSWLLFGGLSLIFSCAQVRQNNERYYYKQARDSLQGNLDPNNLCDYDFRVPYPGFVADDNVQADFDRLDPNKKPAHLKDRVMIHYSPRQMEKIRHETVHYLNRMAPGETKRQNVSWECLDEMLSQEVGENLILKDLLSNQEKKTRYYRRKANQR